MTNSEAVREKLEEITKGAGRFSRDPLIHAANTVEDMKDLAREAIALMEGEQGMWITGFVREIGSSKQLFQFHVRQSNPKEIPYEGPMDPAVLILSTPTDSEGE